MEKSLYIDSDSFFGPAMFPETESMTHQLEGIPIEIDTQSWQSVFEQYYLGLRSTLILGAVTSEEERKEGLNFLKEWREACIAPAIYYTKKHFTSTASLPIDFLRVNRMEIINTVKHDYKDVEKVIIKLSMKPSISAQIKNNNTIVFPALVRTLLTHCNLVLINEAFSIIEDEQYTIDRRYLARFIFPYLLFCHDDISVGNLPWVGAYSEEAVKVAFTYTDLQIKFILAHEYGHILLKHFDYIHDRTERGKLENEADAFAMDVLMKELENDVGVLKSNVFTAIRWLFKYQLLEERIGVLIRGDNLSDHVSTYENRRSSFQSELINRYGLPSTSKIDMCGFAEIVELQNILSEYGKELINAIIHAFNKFKQAREVDPWWEMIVKK